VEITFGILIQVLGLIMNKTFLMIGACMLLTSCIFKQACYENSGDKWIVCNTEGGYTFWYPLWIEENEERQVDVYAYDLKEPCSPDTIGASFINKMGIVEESFWGKVDYYDIYWSGDFPNATSPVCRYSVGEVGYGFCSQRDNKTVIICVEQLQDDPQLAKEIFETFRWTR